MSLTFLKNFYKNHNTIDNIVSMVPTYVSCTPKTWGFYHLQNLIIWQIIYISFKLKQWRWTPQVDLRPDPLGVKELFPYP